jgi:hypothetical protein
MVGFNINVVDTSYSLIRVLIYDRECLWTIIGNIVNIWYLWYTFVAYATYPFLH